MAVPENEISFQQYRNAIRVVLEKFEIPENVNNKTARKYTQLMEEAEDEDYSIYNVAVGVK
ncbi:MAG: hypothetical protein ABEJ56_03485 [Candidatus Nanohaloarchaea archaeon]